MLHTFECEQCKKPWYAACFEHLNYTDVGYEVRKRQMHSGLCPSCFPEKAEMKSDDEQQVIPITVFGGAEGIEIFAAKSADEVVKAI